jgi:hypothetical protein
MSAFVSHDGDGTEVYVSTATAKVTKIEERTSSVNVHLEASYLKHPLNGWLNSNEEVLQVLRDSLENGKEVEVRIEAQRKPKVDKSIPIQEIRDGKDAKTDIIKKIACVNGVFTSEALTNPDDDPDTGKAKSALGRSGGAPKAAGGNNGGPSADKGTVLGLLRNLSTSRDVTESILDALKAQALIAGATVQEIVEASAVPEQEAPAQQNGFAREAPPFKEYNADGRLNLGGASVAAGVGVFNYVFEKMAKTFEAEPDIDTVEYLSALILSIADVLQVGAYGKGFRVDRTAGSHTRARASLFTVIDINPLPVAANGKVASPDVVNAWVKKVGAVTRLNLATGITASQQFPSVKTLLDFLSNDGGAKEQAPQAAESASKPVGSEQITSAPQTVSKPVEATTEAPKPVEKNTGSTADVAYPETATKPTTDVAYPNTVNKPTTDVAYPDTVVEPTYDVAPVAETKAAPKATSPAPENESTPDDGLIRFEQKLLPPGAINASNAPSEEILEQFKEFVIEETGLKTKAEQAKVGRLLSYTFGRAYNKASNIPEDDLADFLDFYVSTGVENFKAVLESM